MHNSTLYRNSKYNNCFALPVVHDQYTWCVYFYIGPRRGPYALIILTCICKLI